MAESVVAIGADLSKLRRELGKIPNMADKEMQKLLIAVEKQTQKAEQAARAANKRMAASTKAPAKGLKNVADSAGDADSAIKAIGGAVGLAAPEFEGAAFVVGEMGAAIEGLIRLGGTALPVVGAMAAAAAAAGLAYQAWAEKQERLKRINETLSTALQENLTATRTLEGARLDLAVAVGDLTEKERALLEVRRAAFVEGLEPMQEMTASITEQQAAVTKLERTLKARKEGMANTDVDLLEEYDIALKLMISDEATLTKELEKERAKLDALNTQRDGLVDKTRELVKVQTETIGATDRGTRAATAQAEAVEEQRASRARLIAQLNAQRETETALSVAAQQASAAQADALQSVGAALGDQEMAVLRSQATYDQAAAARIQAMAREEALLRNLSTAATALVEREAAIEAEYAAQLATLDRLEEAGVERAEIEARAAELTIQREEQIAELREQNEAIHQAGIRARMQLEDAAHQERLLQAQQQGQAFGDLFGAIGGAASAAAETMSKSNRDAAMQAFRAYKAAAIAQAAINAALAITDVWSEHAANPIVAGVLTAAAAIATGAQIGMIAAQEPTFDVGGIIGPAGGGGRSMAPDQVPVRALPNEAILNRSAVSRLGREGVERLNRGEDPAGPTVVALPVYRHFDRYVADEARRGGSLTRAIGRGVRTGRRRG